MTEHRELDPLIVAYMQGQASIKRTLYEVYEYTKDRIIRDQAFTPKELEDWENQWTAMLSYTDLGLSLDEPLAITKETAVRVISIDKAYKEVVSLMFFDLDAALDDIDLNEEEVS